MPTPHLPTHLVMQVWHKALPSVFVTWVSNSGRFGELQLHGWTPVNCSMFNLKFSVIRLIWAVESISHIVCLFLFVAWPFGGRGGSASYLIFIYEWGDDNVSQLATEFGYSGSFFANCNSFLMVHMVPLPFHSSLAQCITEQLVNHKWAKIIFWGKWQNSYFIDKT